MWVEPGGFERVGTGSSASGSGGTRHGGAAREGRAPGSRLVSLDVVPWAHVRRAPAPVVSPSLARVPSPAAPSSTAPAQRIPSAPGRARVPSRARARRATFDVEPVPQVSTRSCAGAHRACGARSFSTRGSHAARSSAGAPRTAPRTPDATRLAVAWFTSPRSTLRGEAIRPRIASLTSRVSLGAQGLREFPPSRRACGTRRASSARRTKLRVGWYRGPSRS